MIIVDRIENDIAVCEIDGVMYDIPLSRIKGRVREGDILHDNGESLPFTIDRSGTARRKAEISERFENLKAKKKPFYVLTTV